MHQSDVVPVRDGADPVRYPSASFQRLLLKAKCFAADRYFMYDWIAAPQAPAPPLVIPGEVSTFTYDLTGGVATAINHDAKITRTYYPNGALKSDELKIAVVDSANTPADAVYDRSANGLHAHLEHLLGVPSLPVGSVLGSYACTLGAVVGLASPVVRQGRALNDLRAWVLKRCSSLRVVNGNRRLRPIHVTC
ncbi:MAG: hypothetical protein ABI969_09600 [bacterium]